MDPITRANRVAWEDASLKHVREFDELLVKAADGSSLLDVERSVLGRTLDRLPAVVHLQSGHGLDDVALIQAGASASQPP